MSEVGQEGSRGQSPLFPGLSPRQDHPSARPKLPPNSPERKDTATSIKHPVPSGPGPEHTAPQPRLTGRFHTASLEQSPCRAGTAERRSGRHRQLRAELRPLGATLGRAGSEGAAAGTRPEPSPASPRAPPNLPAARGRGAAGEPRCRPPYLDGPGRVAVDVVGHGRRLVHGAGGAGRARGARGSLPAPPSGRGAPAAAPAALLRTPGRRGGSARRGRTRSAPPGTAPPAGPAPDRDPAGPSRPRPRRRGDERGRPRSLKAGPAVLSAEMSKTAAESLCWLLFPSCSAGFFCSLPSPFPPAASSLGSERLQPTAVAGYGRAYVTQVRGTGSSLPTRAGSQNYRALFSTATALRFPVEQRKCFSN